MPRKKKGIHFLYKTTNLLNGNFYIGVHSTYNIDDGYLGSGLRIRRSIRKYGAKYFKREILEFFDNRAELLEKEKFLVNEDMLKDPLCMNLKEGGRGGWTNEQQSKNGKRAAISQKILRETDEAWVNRKSEKISGALRQAYKDGKKIIKPPDWIGRQHSDDTKKKIGDKNSLYQQGNKNSQFETCWIYNIELKINKKIKINDVEQFPGWIKGRKMKFT